MAITRPKAPSLFDYSDANGGLQLTFAVAGAADSAIVLFDDNNNNGEQDTKESVYTGSYQGGQWLFQTEALTPGKHHFGVRNKTRKRRKKSVSITKAPSPPPNCRRWALKPYRKPSRKINSR